MEKIIQEYTEQLRRSNIDEEIVKRNCAVLRDFFIRFEKWDEEFEDEIYACGKTVFPEGGEVQTFELDIHNFQEMIEKYIGSENKIKISCKKGIIKIERII